MNRILVVQTGKLGDMVCTTPVFRAIKQRFPNSELIVAGDGTNKSVIAGNPHVSEYLLHNELSMKQIRKKSFDAAVLLAPNPRLLWMLLLAGVRKIIVPKVVGGFSPYATKTYRLLSLFAIRIPHRMRHYAPQEYLNMLAPLGIVSVDTRKELYYTPGAGRKIAAMLEGCHGKYKVAMSPSAGNKVKNWGGSKFACVAEEVYKRYLADIFVIGTERDREEVKEMFARLLSTVPVTDLSCKLNVDELKAFISRMDVFIAVDTGPIYIAEAFGVATVDIIGPMDESEQPPRGEKHKVVYLQDRKGPELHIMNARMYNEKEARRQVESITPEMVLESIVSVLV